jgi:hypothetical protein
MDKKDYIFGSSMKIFYPLYDRNVPRKPRPCGRRASSHFAESDIDLSKIKQGHFFDLLSFVQSLPQRGNEKMQGKIFRKNGLSLLKS